MCICQSGASLATRAARFGRRLLWIILIASLASEASAEDEGPIKVGILHSLSGTMAISESRLKDLLVMLIEEQNEAGGLLGRQIVAVVNDPASDEEVFAAQARELITREGVDVIFGCWTSSSRKSVLPVVEELNALLFYPVQYEGQESSRNIFYFGATPNQQAIPAIDYLRSEEGGEIRRWALIGTDYVYPRTTNEILKAYLNFNGVSDSDIIEFYTPFGHQDWREIVSQVRQFSELGLPTAIVSTINGDANLHFYSELTKQQLNTEDVPVMAFSVGEGELTELHSQALVGLLASWNYFMSAPSSENDAFIERWRQHLGDPDAVINDPMAAHRTGFKMWVQAVEQAGTTDSDAVRQAMYGQVVRDLTGNLVTMTANHHTSKPALVGEIQTYGQFKLLWSSDGVIQPDAWSDFLLESANLTADWRYPWVCGGCESPRFSSPEN